MLPLWVERLKGSLPVEQPIAGDELGAISAISPHATDKLPWLFQALLTRQAVNYMVRFAGEKAKLGRVWSHMLRHSCGNYSADQGTICPPCRLSWPPRSQAHGALHTFCRGIGSKVCGGKARRPAVSLAS
jgi:integrase